MISMQHASEKGGHVAGPRRLTVKRHPVVLVRNFLALQFASGGIYIGAGSLAHFARIWRGLPLVGYYFPFTLAQVAFVLLAEVILVMYIFLSWHRTNLNVYDGYVSVSGGVVRRFSRRMEVAATATVSFKQNLLGRLTKYGTVMVRQGDASWRLKHIPEPEQFMHAIHGASGVARVLEDPKTVLASPEDNSLEFKSSLRWDTRTGKVNRSLEKAALKTVAAFLNSRGGHLVLGVGDDRSVRGLKEDIATLQRKDQDGFEVHVGNLFNSMIGAHLRHCLSVNWAEYEGKQFCVLSVAPAAEPAYVRADNAEEFFVRTGNGTTALTVSQVPTYLKNRFKN